MLDYSLVNKEGRFFYLEVGEYTIDLEVDTRYSITNMWYKMDEERFKKDVSELISYIQEKDKLKILINANSFKKICKTKGFSLFDLYNLMNEEGSHTSHLKSEFSFKKEFLHFYGRGLDEEVLKLEKLHNLNILVYRKKVTLNLNGTDLTKNYSMETFLTIEQLEEFIKQFKSVIKKDKKLNDYIAFSNKHGLGKYSYIAKSYGFGVFHLYNIHFREQVQSLRSIMDDANIPYDNEFSDKGWIYRFKVSNKNIKEVA